MNRTGISGGIGSMKRCSATGLLLFLCLIIVLCAAPAYAGEEGYTLDKVVVLSRHNIRSPLDTSGSLIGDITAHKWFRWTSSSSELSRKGAILETIMGQYFRLVMEEEGLFPVNYIPKEGAVRFYANAKQRTIATTRYFSAGLLPVANAGVETHAEYDTMDPVFNPVVHFTSPVYEKDVLARIARLGSGGTIESIHADLKNSILLLMKVIDPTDTEAYNSGQYGDLLSDETKISFEVGKEPSMEGAIKNATSLADALTLQYYEEPDELKASFGEKLTGEDWMTIHRIVDTYSMMLFGTYPMAVNAAHPLLQELRSEMGDKERRFSFLCGHDSNVLTVLTALEAEAYELPDTLEALTPVGVKLVFERWIAEDGKAYYTASLVYQSTQQLREMTMLSPDVPPVKVPIHFEGISENEKGMILEEEFLARMDEAIGAYDDIKEYYLTGSETESELPDKTEKNTKTEGDVAQETELAA